MTTNQDVSPAITDDDGEEYLSDKVLNDGEEVANSFWKRGAGLQGQAV
jgi:hypothetical protein